MGPIPGGIMVLLLGALLLFVMRNRERKEPPPPPRASLPEVARTNLVLIEGRLYQSGAEKAFVGYILDHYPDGSLRSRSAVSNGVLHGMSEGYYTNAQVQVQEPFVEGVSHGVRAKFYPNGVRLSEAEITGGELNGRFQRWYENGQLSQVAEFKDGKAEGVSWAFYESGYVKAHVVTTNGVPVEQTYWEDGEREWTEGGP